MADSDSAAAGIGRRPHRVRNMVLIVGAFVVVLGVATGGVLAFRVFDKATAIDRSTPQVVTVQFLDAALVLKDTDRVALFICEDWSAAEALAKTDAPKDPRVSSSWGDITVQANGSSATAVVRVIFRFSTNGDYQQDPQLWTLLLSHEDGWRVCDLTKEPSLEP